MNARLVQVNVCVCAGTLRWSVPAHSFSFGITTLRGPKGEEGTVQAMSN